MDAAGSRWTDMDLGQRREGRSGGGDGCRALGRAAEQWVVMAPGGRAAGVNGDPRARIAGENLPRLSYRSVRSAGAQNR